MMSGIKETSNSATGGDSFCYMIFPQNSIAGSRAMPTFVSVGKYPLSNIDVRIVDIDSFNRRTASHPNLSLQELVANDIRLRIDELSANSSAINFAWSVPLADSDKQNLRIFYSARNGFWSEDLGIRHINGKYLEALKVWRQEGKKTFV
jgi:hypothetical protein